MRALLLLLFTLAGCTAPPTWDVADFACDFVDAFDEPLACSSVTQVPELLFDPPGRQGHDCLWNTRGFGGPLPIDILREKDGLLDSPQGIPTYYVGFPAGGPEAVDPDRVDRDVSHPTRNLTGLLGINTNDGPRVLEWVMPKEPHWIAIEGVEDDWLDLRLWVENVRWISDDPDLPPLNVVYDARVVGKDLVSHWHRWIVLESEGFYTTGTDFVPVYGNNDTPGGGLVERHYSQLPTPNGMQDILVGEWWSLAGFGAHPDDRAEGCTMTDDRIVPIPPINVQRPGLNSSIMDGVRVVRG